MTQKTDKYIVSGNPKVDIIYHNIEWIITALAGTLVFIVFIMQVYRIPTGSMAETLRGSHFRLRCEQCGYRYDYDFIGAYYPKNFGFIQTSLPRADIPVLPPFPRCPSCGHYENTGLLGQDGRSYIQKDNKILLGQQRAVCRGDQIFVLKCIYQLFEPKRWDVIVFKNPTDPRINYIKRLVGLPGEKAEIIDGDIYIDDVIQRKPPKVQEEQWMCVYDNDYQPIRPDEKSFNGHTWAQPFEPFNEAKWTTNSDGSPVFTLDCPNDSTLQILRYNQTVGNSFRATYAYDASQYYTEMPVCSDLMIRYYVKMKDNSGAGVQLGKYGIRYQGLIDSNGRMSIWQIDDKGPQKELASGKWFKSNYRQMQFLEFANVDHKLILRYGSDTIEYDLGTSKHDAGMDRLSSPSAAIAGFGSLELRHIKLFRDIHYRGADDNRVKRAQEGNPLQLEADEFFACGDNSPNSLDARMWDDVKANPGLQYRVGVVPRDYMVGKAFFVHFPGNWRFDRQNWRVIPYLDGPPEPDGMKIIYGGRQ